MPTTESSGPVDTEWVLYVRLPAWRNPYTVFLGFMGLLAIGMCVMLLNFAPTAERHIAVAYVVVVAPLILYMLWLGAWSYCGREEIGVSDGNLLVRKRVCGIPYMSHQYHVSGIGRLGVRECPKLSWMPASWLFMGRQLGFGDGPITFEYEGDDVRIAEALRNDPVAAEELAERLRVGLHLDA